MKLVADMLAKKSYKEAELKELRAWIDKHIGKRLAVKTKAESENFNRSLSSSATSWPT